MKYSNINYFWADLIIEELIRCGAGPFCVAPGSRNTPLALTVASKTGGVSHFDERGLGFYALGSAIATGKPPVLICTSGSAVVNFFPAVAECSKKKLPMIVLSADRPYEAKDTGAPQTMNQNGLFGSFVSWDTNLPAPSVEIKPEVVLTTIDYAVSRTSRPGGSPVHINCMFREPLEPGKPEDTIRDYGRSLEMWSDSSQAYTLYSAPVMDAVIPENLINAALKTERGVIGVGKLKSEKDRIAVIKLAEKLNWPVFADVTSGLKLDGRSENIIVNYDQILLGKNFTEELHADFVLQIGGRITAKRWLEYVDESRPEYYVMVLGHSLRNDPLHKVTHRIESSAGVFADKFCEGSVLSNESNRFTEKLQTLDKLVGNALESSSVMNDLNDISVARVISAQINCGDTIYLASSMPVRDMDMYGKCIGKNIEVVSNRGLNGIDGIIASAAGYTANSKGRTTLIIGDLATLHDLNSLALIKDKPVTLVINNNGGGGIFSFLPASAKGGEDFDRLCAAPHSFKFEKAAEMFEIDYESPATLEEFCEIYSKSLKSNKPYIIEVFSRREDNLDIHKKLAGECRDVVAEFLK